MATFISLRISGMGDERASSLEIERGGTLRIVGALRHGEQIEPATPADAKLLREWAERSETRAARDTLEGMTQARWDSLTEAERHRLRSDAGLSPQLRGLEGWRVEVETTYGETRRFIVGRSTGWVPCHLEIARANSSGGMPAEKHYKSVRRLYKVRG